ncbi:MAG: primosomal protein N' [Ruminococcaceae bacterium]|nr:primosomal protein N' [Oscillospiraceae bacterium]
MEQFNTAEVYILDLPYSADIGYSYRIDPSLKDRIKLGSFVCVPFGRNNKLCAGVVGRMYTCIDSKVKLKSVASIFSDTVVEALSEEMLKLCFYMKETTFCSIGDAVRTILPTGTLGRVDKEYFATAGLDTSHLGVECTKIYEYIVQRSFTCRDGHGVYLEELSKKFGEGLESELSKLVGGGFISREYRIKSNTKAATLEYAELTRPCDDEMMIALSRSQKQKQIVKYIDEFGACSVGELREKLGATRVMLNSLITKGLVKISSVKQYRIPYGDKQRSSRDNILSSEQKNAFETISAICEEGKPKAVLLHGVTGSGKTRVMKSVIDKVIEAGKSVIVLVPEISLTPQTVSLFSSFYGNDIAVLHSSLSNGERFDEWRRMYEGRAKICIGTRSAVFAPFNDLGLIIIDEEQEHTYKSDMTPRYHARDIARFRCAHNNAVMLLSSATPSVETYYKAKNGTYTLVELKNRYSGNDLPETTIFDTRGTDMTKPVSELLRMALCEKLENKEQAILFVNRRGYSNFATCSLCGFVIKCPNCSVSLTYHTKDKTPVGWADSLGARIENGYLLCHYCGYKSRVPEKCPECSSRVIQFMGYGTQYVEKHIKSMFKEAEVLRLDADSTKTKYAFDSMLDDFRSQKQDIMLGTQMVTKGHDFPGVTLVGVINADAGLYMGDYRAAEKTFSLITQVIGRAGRAEKSGKAIIQTSSPDNPTLLLAAKQDYKGFYENEIAMRHALVFPPFCDIAAITFSSEDEKALANSVNIACQKLKEMLEGEYSELRLQVFGPMEAPVYKIRDKMRMKIIIKCKSNKATRKALSELLIYTEKKSGSNVAVNIDMNPSAI